MANAYALDARDGHLIWKVRVDSHPAAAIHASPVLIKDRLYLAVTDHEENFSGPEYQCCTGRGAIVALDPRSGISIWKTYTIPRLPTMRHNDGHGNIRFGPSGASVWSAPTIDLEKDRMYFTTGNNFSDPPDENSDAIFALELATGRVKWRTQTKRGDVWTTWAEHCGQKSPSSSTEPHCDDLNKVGPDIDFAAPPVLVRTQTGASILLAGRKDGTIFGVDPSRGKVLWVRRVSQTVDPYSSELLFGMMSNGDVLFVPSTGSKGPYFGTHVPSVNDGIHAFEVATGKSIFDSRVTDDCPKLDPCLGITSALIGFSGVVFSGSLDGIVRAHSTDSGKVLWRFDTVREFTAVNGDTVKGQSIVGSAISLGFGMLYVNSGEALLAFDTQDD